MALQKMGREREGCTRLGLKTGVNLRGGEMDRSKNAVKLMIEFVVCDRDMSQL